MVGMGNILHVLFFYKCFLNLALHKDCVVMGFLLDES